MATNVEHVPSPPNKSEIFKCDKHAASVLKNIQSLYEDQQLFDIALVAGAERVKVQAHRIILLLTSKYFRSMFRTNLQEATANEVELKEIDGDIVKLIVEFLYTGSIELRTETVQEILRAADYLELPTLIVACWKFVGKLLDVSNCVGIALFAQQYSLTELFKQSSDFACKNLEKVCKEEEFLEMSSTQLTELLASDDASVPSEELVFRGVMAWINHDKANRDDLMSELLSVVRFPLLTPQFISEHVVPICERDECRKLILKWFQWHHLPSFRLNFANSLSTKLRKANRKACVLYGVDTHSLSIQTFDRDLNLWSCQELPSTHKRRTGFGAILRNGKLIITGGMCDNIRLNTVDCLDLMTLKWTALPPMREARKNHAMAEVGGNLYVIGGDSPNDLGFPMEMYDFSTEKWKDLAPVPQYKFETYLRSTVLNGMLFISCGRKYLSYNLANNEWTHLPTTVCMTYSGLVAVGECLYSVGGADKKDCVKSFNLSSFELKQVKSLTEPRCYMSCIALNGRVLVCGGSNGGNTVEEYNPETDKWTVLAPMLHKDKLYYLNSL